MVAHPTTSLNSPLSSSLRISFRRPSGIFSSLITVLPSCARTLRAIRGTPLPRQSSRRTGSHVRLAAECPAGLELADCTALEPDQRDAVVLGLDRVHERIRPAHDLDRSVVLADEVPDDLDAVAPEVDDRAASGLVVVPEPRAVRSRMRLSRPRPRDVAELA